MSYKKYTQPQRRWKCLFIQSMLTYTPKNFPTIYILHQSNRYQQYSLNICYWHRWPLRNCHRFRKKSMSLLPAPTVIRMVTSCIPTSPILVNYNRCCPIIHANNAALQETWDKISTLPTFLPTTQHIKRILQLPRFVLHQTWLSATSLRKEFLQELKERIATTVTNCNSSNTNYRTTIKRQENLQTYCQYNIIQT